MKEIEQPMTESTVSRSNIQWGIVGQSLDIGYFLINQEIGPLEHLISKWIN